MKKCVLVGALACCCLVALSASPADAGPLRRNRGGREAVYYSDGGYMPYYGYDSYGGSSYYVTPYAASNYGWNNGWPPAYVGMPAYGNQYSYGYPGYGINSYVAPAAWDTSNPQYSATARDLNTYRSFYTPTQNGTDATIRVRVPNPTARVFFDDTVTRQQGMERVFASPPLDPDKSYSYIVRATWMENGKEVTRSKDVKVQAGRTAMVDFRGSGDNRGINEQIEPKPREDRRDLNPDNPPRNPNDKNRTENPRDPGDN